MLWTRKKLKKSSIIVAQIEFLLGYTIAIDCIRVLFMNYETPN